MAKYKGMIFHVPCNCYELVDQDMKAKGMSITGIKKIAVSRGDSRLTTIATSAVLGPSGKVKHEIIVLAYCPFCAAPLVTKEIDQVSDEHGPK